MNFNKTLQNEHGSVLAIVIILLSLILVTTTGFFTSTQIHQTGAIAELAHQKSYYAAEGLRLAAVQLTQNYLSANTVPSDATLLSEYSTKLSTSLADPLTGLPVYIQSGYTLKSVTATLSSESESVSIASGPFKGMIAPQIKIRLRYSISSNTGTDSQTVVETADTTMTLAQLGLHQFMYFIDLTLAGLNPGADMKVNGRLHANGDLCLGGHSGEFLLQSVSASGHIWHSQRTECGLVQDTTTSLTTTKISDTGDLSSWKLFGVGANGDNVNRNDDGCTNCLNSGYDWATYAPATWNDNVTSSAQGAVALRLPLPTDVLAQIGANGPDEYTGMTNTQNLRFLIDPPVTGEPEEAAEMKYAVQADVRIVDGIWYLKIPSNPTKWPGHPIWSDHPGHFTDKSSPTQQVGQSDLKSAGRWSSTVPSRYSYYNYEEGSSSLVADTRGVISYGQLTRSATSPYPSWTPGQILNETLSYTPTSGTTTTNSSRNYLCKPDGSVAATTAAGSYEFNTMITCSNSTWNPPKATNIINATRSGFHNPHIALWARKNNTDNSGFSPTTIDRILPTNFDVAQFQAALQDTTPGELGSYFGTGRYMGRSFNGIVFITTTYPGSDKGFSPAGAPDLWPPQHDGSMPLNDNAPGGDAAQIPLTSWYQQRSLPYQLCTNAATSPGDPAPAPGEGYDSRSGITHFVIPDCADYPSAIGAYPNAIRIHNGSNLSTSVFSSGLTIASNMPVYVLGGYNRNSSVTPNLSSTTPWIPTLIAGDQITLLSDGWDDSNAPFTLNKLNLSVWSTTVIGVPPTIRTAESTTYNVSFLTGWSVHEDVESATKVGMHALPALMEDWTGKNLNLNGSIAVGFYPVYDRAGRYYYDNLDQLSQFELQSYMYWTYRADNRSFVYDQHLSVSTNQPPGSPTFYSSSVNAWNMQ